MSTLHLFETEAEARAQEEQRPLSSRKRVFGAIAAVCLLASGGLVAARHNARNNEPSTTPPAVAAPGVTDQLAAPVPQRDVAAPAPAPEVAAPPPTNPAPRRVESPAPAPVSGSTPFRDVEIRDGAFEHFRRKGDAF